FCATAAFAAPGGAGRRLPPARPRAACRTGKLNVSAARSAAFATAEQLHAIGDDFGRVFFDAVLVGVLACLQSTLNIDRAAFFQIFSGDLGLAAEQHDTVPFGALLRFAALVLPLLARCDVQVGDRVAAGRVTRFGITAQIAEQDHLVD